MAMPTQHQISEMLVNQKTNLCAWSKEHDYKYKTVFMTVSRWAGRDDRTPHGGIARMIMCDLAEDVEAFEVRSSEELTANLTANQDC
jgi:hypothetical protein